MPRESTNLKLKLYNAVIDAKELAKDWFSNIFDYSNSNWVKIDDAYKEIKDKFDEYPTKDGTGATGNWNINAESATNDSAGQQIDSTYVKNVESTDDGKLIVTKGNGDTSTADVSTPAGYNKAGVVKIGNNIDVEQDGTISIPKASTNTSGVVKIGNNIDVKADGTISIPKASTNTSGVVKIGNNIDVKADGEISIRNYAGSSSSGGTANSVNNFTFKAQTSDPGAGSSLATGTVLFVYS